jgi:hypothetical protein
MREGKMQKFNITIEDGIGKIERNFKGYLDAETRQQLDNMKVGQSFTVPNKKQKTIIYYYGRRTGKKFSSVKVYTSTARGVDAPHHYRIWLDGGKPKPLLKTSRYNKYHKVSNFGSLSKSNVSEGEGEATTRHNISQEVLAMAELRADNKRIVEDMEHIKKVLIQELGHDLIYRPVREDD